MTIRHCTAADIADPYAVCNGGASAYRGVIPAHQWKTPYLPGDELRSEILAAVEFVGVFDFEQELVGVIGLQQVGDVALVRHAYTLTSRQKTGIGSALLAHLQLLADRPIIIGMWRATTWTSRFHERGFELIEGPGAELTAAVLDGPGKTNRRLRRAGESMVACSRCVSLPTRH